MDDSLEPMGTPPAKEPGAGAARPTAPAAALLAYAIRSSSGLFILCGLWVVGSAVVTLNSGPDSYGRGPNVIIQDDQERSDRFYTMFSTVLGAGVALAAVGGLISLRQRWAVYLAFPVTLAAALIWAGALFASNADILWFMVFSVGAPVLLCADLVWVLVCYRGAKIEAEYQGLRGDDSGSGGEDEGIAKVVRLLRHPKKSIRVEAIRELTSMGPSASPAVPELVASLLKATPPALSEKGVCMFCAQPLSIWTRDRLKTEQHPKGLPACMGCRNRLVAGEPSEAHLVAEALAAIGPAASAAVPALRKVSSSHDPLLASACRDAIPRITGTADSPAGEDRSRVAARHGPRADVPEAQATGASTASMDEFIRFVCPGCGKSLKARREYARRRVKCSGRECGLTVDVPPAEPIYGQESQGTDGERGRDF